MKKLLLVVAIMFAGAAVLRTLLPGGLARLREHLSSTCAAEGCECSCHQADGRDTDFPEGGETEVTASG
jgi:hypothetical protein